MINVFNFSCGKTSGYMTIKYWKPGDLVIFTDTGREHPETYKFIGNFIKNEGIPVHLISYKNSDKPFDLLLSEKKYKVIPNRMKRVCTKNLKIDTAKRYLKSIGVLRFNNYIGIRYDEQPRILKHKERFKKVKTFFPLNEDHTTKEIVNEFWENKSYNLNIPPILGNCTLCFLKGQNAILNILRNFPELANEWINDEKQSELINGNGNGRTYFKDITIENLKNLAQNNLFKETDLYKVKPAYNCECNNQ